MKALKNLTANVVRFPRRDIVAVMAYLNQGLAVKCVDGTFHRHDHHLNRLAAAARMQ